MKELLEQHRANFKGLAEIVNNELERTRENSLAITALQEAQMFSGNTIGSFGVSANPYPESKNPENTIIEPVYVAPNLIAFSLPELWNSMEYIQKVKWCQMKLEEEINNLIIKNLKGENRYFDVVIISAVRAKNWLGMELGRILKSQSKETKTQESE